MSVKISRVAVFKQRLQELQGKIAAHPFSDPQIVAAKEIIDNSSGLSPEEIDSKLRAQNLPSLQDVGSNTLKHMVSFWNLHRKRRKLEAKIAKLDGAKA